MKLTGFILYRHLVEQFIKSKKQPEAMTKNGLKLCAIAIASSFLLTTSCNVMRKADRSVKITKTAAVPEEFKRYIDAEEVQLRTNITGWAQNYVGHKYRYATADPRKGFDCSGFTSYVMGEYKIKISPGSTTQAKQGAKVTLQNAQPGDLIFFGKKGRISHVALLIENNENGLTVVHSTNTRGVVVENVSQSDYWKKKILFARDVFVTRS
jgi:cell wall-associated NlpC family hydrolase